MEESDLVALLINLPDKGLSVGDVGTIAHVYRTGQAYVVEFVNASGETVAVETLEENQVVKVTGKQAILHVHLPVAA